MMRIWQQNVLLVAWLLLLAGCISKGVTWPPSVQPLVTPALSSPQTVASEIPWRVSMRGEADDLVYEFILADGEGEVSVQKGKATEWRWRPTRTGRYRVKVVVEDGAGHRLAGGWSPDYEIVSALRLLTLVPDKPSPQQAGMGAIGWQVTARGGVPPLVYEFISRREGTEAGAPHLPETGPASQSDNWHTRMEFRDQQGELQTRYGKELIEQQGESPTWQWHPLERGFYRITARVRDAAGNSVESEQSVDYEILAPLAPGSLIAVLPLQNMSGTKVPGKKIQERLENMLRRKGMRLVDERVMQDFIVRHRIRYTAGVDGDLARALREETGAEAVLFCVVELYREEIMPKMSLTVWLDMCSDPPRVLWMASKSLSGDATPGLLDLGMVRDADRLLDRVLVSLFASWVPSLLPPAAAVTNEEAAVYRTQPWQGDGAQRFRPQEYYRSEIYSPQQRYTVAVMPFYNLSERKYAGELMELNFVRQLRQLPTLTVIEPGELRQYLLRYRIIMEDGLSLANTEVIFAKLGVDLIVSGKVFDYEDYVGMVGKPIVDFSVEIFSREGNKPLWTSKSYTNGEKGVFFFDIGKVYTAHNLAGQMVGAIAGMLGQ
jgi:TolB-like protein